VGYSWKFKLCLGLSIAVIVAWLGLVLFGTPGTDCEFPTAEEYLKRADAAAVAGDGAEFERNVQAVVSVLGGHTTDPLDSPTRARLFATAERLQAWSAQASLAEQQTWRTPDNATAWRELGRILLNKVRKPVEAVDAYRRAAELEPNEPEGHLGLGYALLATGDYDGATAELQAAVSLAPPDVAWAAEAQKAMIEAHLRKNTAGAPR